MSRIAFGRAVGAISRIREGWAESGGEPTDEGKIKRTAVRELADCQPSRSLCLHIGFWNRHDWR